MSNIFLKRSSVSGKVPLAANLNFGEVALNYADGVIYYKDSASNIQSVGSVHSTPVSITTTTNATGTTTGALIVAGGVGIGGNLYVGGAVTATNMFIGPWPVSTGTSGGASFTGGTVAGLTTFTNTLTVADIVINNRIFAGGTTGTNGQVLIATGSGVQWTSLSSTFNGGTITSPLVVNNSTSATSTTTGALQVVGGVGVGGDVQVGGNITATNVFVGPWPVSTSTSAGGLTNAQVYLQNIFYN